MNRGGPTGAPESRHSAITKLFCAEPSTLPASSGATVDWPMSWDYIQVVTIAPVSRGIGEKPQSTSRLLTHRLHHTQLRESVDNKLHSNGREQEAHQPHQDSYSCFPEEPADAVGGREYEE